MNFIRFLWKRNKKKVCQRSKAKIVEGGKIQPAMKQNEKKRERITQNEIWEKGPAGQLHRFFFRHRILFGRGNLSPWNVTFAGYLSIHPNQLWNQDECNINLYLRWALNNSLNSWDISSYLFFTKKIHQRSTPWGNKKKIEKKRRWFRQM